MCRPTDRAADHDVRNEPPGRCRVAEDSVIDNTRSEPVARRPRPTPACRRSRRRPTRRGRHRTLHPFRDPGHRNTDRAMPSTVVMDRRAALRRATATWSEGATPFSVKPRRTRSPPWRAAAAPTASGEGCRRGLQAERLWQLRQEQRHAVLQLARRDRWPRPAANPIPRTGNDRVSVQVAALVQPHVPRHQRRAAVGTDSSCI